MIIVLDFGSQYTQLITRRIRELEVFSEILPCTTDPETVDRSKLKGIILSGGPASVTADDAPAFSEKWLELGVPVLGVCYGMHLISHLAGAKLTSGDKREYGHANLQLHGTSRLFDGIDPSEELTVWMSHGDHVDELPEGFEVLASSDGLPIAAIGSEEKQVYALQFHPEVVHTTRGEEILANFVYGITGCEKEWTPDCFIQSSIEKIQGLIDDDANVICGLSGGVDSSVAAVLVDKAIHNQLYCIFVDNGLLRQDEVEEVKTKLGEKGVGLHLTVVDAADKFLKELAGVTDPEQKRKIIGRVFIEVFEEEAAKIPNVSHLVQGTLYPDVIESVSVRGPSVTIKTHHNVGGLPEKMNLKLLEPFRELFKDEVRKLGRELEVPAEIVNRQPFPGPGLAVRVLGEITRERLTILRQADKIFHEEIVAGGFYDTLWQSFCVLLPVNSVGVMGDGRTYEQVAALRAVTSLDAMTADWYYLPEDLLKRTSNRIINEVKGINRVVLDISSKPPATIEWE